jgi:hypothetical protein
MRIFVSGQGTQANAQIDAEIGQKDHLWMETNYCQRVVAKTTTNERRIKCMRLRNYHFGR